MASRFFIAALVFFFSGILLADEYRLLDVDRIEFEGWKTLHKRDPYLYQYTSQWTNGASFNLNLSACRYLKWRNQIHMDGTTSGLKMVGWFFDISTSYSKYWTPFYQHHSQHALDRDGASAEPYASNSFPLVDLIGVRLIFYTKE